MTSAQRSFLLTLIAIGLVTSVAVLVQRVAVEGANNTVGVAVDYLEVEQLAGATGVTLEAMMQQLRAAGATHLALSEDSLQSLLDRGEAMIVGQDGTTRIRLSSAYRLQQVATALSSRFPGSYTRPQGAAGDFWLTCPPAATSVPATGVGYSRQALEAARSVGLQIVARPLWQGIRSRGAVDAALKLAADSGARSVVFSGDQVVGFPGLLGATADALRTHKLDFGFIELAPQSGDVALAAELEYRILRVHSITEAEMRTISVSRAVERFVKAARERGVRLCYLRLFPGDDRGPAHINTEYLTGLCNALGELGLQSGAPAAFGGFGTPWWLPALVRLGVVGAALWIVQAVFGLPAVWFWVLTVVGVLGGTAGMAVMREQACAICALAAAVAFPTLALGWTTRSLTAGRGSGGLGRALLAFAALAGVTAIGGLIIAALLADSAHLTGIARFRGVKLAQLVPLLAVALIWLARGTPQYRGAMADRADGPEWRGLWAGWRGALSNPVIYWHAGAALVGLVVLAVLLVRSGNEAGGAILPGELQFRALLDKLLVVRPRTKEVFLGHPMMLLALLLMLRRARGGLWIAVALGAIGQISLLNSFCHLHTPLLLTLLRVFNGLWLGAIGGLVLCLVWDWAGRLRGGARSSPSPPGAA